MDRSDVAAMLAEAGGQINHHKGGLNAHLTDDAPTWATPEPFPKAVDRHLQGFYGMDVWL